jgi:hypothetical protein
MSSIYKKFKDKISFSKDTLFKYYNNFLESMLVFDVKQFTDSAYKRKRNPAKIYLVDNGLCKNIKLANYGRLLENIVYLKLLRNDNKIFYFSNGYECDFVISKENEKGIYQVCWELTDQNREREIMGLSKTAKQLKLKEANIITNNQTEVIKNNNIKISVFSIKKFLLKN